ncbi:MAG TPA: hypothetical protein PK031_09220 [Pseudomonadales bacterium]|nr:hypothetical protein [Pseudomonadales bacterium]
MFRLLVSAIQTLLLLVLLPVIIPDGAGSTQLPWKKLFPDPVMALRFEYYLDPYRELYQYSKRLIRPETKIATMRSYQDKYGNWHISNAPDAQGKTIAVTDYTADLATATRQQGRIMLALCWLLVFVPFHILKHNGLTAITNRVRNIRLRRPKAPKEKLAEYIPYTVESVTLKTLPDGNTYDSRSELHINQVLQKETKGN